MVHKPVRNVKISVVNQKHQRKSEPEIKRAVLLGIGIKLRISFYRRHQQQVRRRSKNEHGEDRVSDLPPVIFVFRKPELYFFIGNFMAQPAIPNQPRYTGNNYISRSDDKQKTAVR